MASNRIQSLSESPCFQCGCDNECDKKISRNYKLGVIKDNIYGNREFDYHNCGIWIALNAPEMIEVDE